ncbi:hypothetical protein MSTO_22780 [Mycobacterium stomatepiae]|uniref:Uncharacterized protein n=1 Tax=Mycobacterium stomatepiae TaxID=470076 RepID=A0A7I7Q744_9MYCO|nr:hypothetical protein MSTO_22780 [Mycobacterium stomatepiae]
MLQPPLELKAEIPAWTRTENRERTLDVAACGRRPETTSPAPVWETTRSGWRKVTGLENY